MLVALLLGRLDTSFQMHAYLKRFVPTQVVEKVNNGQMLHGGHQTYVSVAQKKGLRLVEIV